jgi:hypothetical protein
MARQKRQLVPVGRRALVARIRRALKAQGEDIRSARSERARIDLGEYYVIDVSANTVMRKGVDLEEFGRSLDLLKPFETLTNDE